jgi:hypothetical protein
MNFLHTDARWTEHFVEVSDPHKEGHHVRFYFEPQRTWVGLTDEDLNKTRNELGLKFGGDEIEFWEISRAIEVKLKEKNCDNRN